MCASNSQRKGMSHAEGANFFFSLSLSLSLSRGVCVCVCLFSSGVSCAGGGVNSGAFGAL